MIINKSELAYILKINHETNKSLCIDLEDYWLCDDKFVTMQHADGYEPLRVVIEHINSQRFKLLAKDIILKLALEQSNIDPGKIPTEEEKAMVSCNVKMIAKEIIDLAIQ